MTPSGREQKGGSVEEADKPIQGKTLIRKQKRELYKSIQRLKM